MMEKKYSEKELQELFSQTLEEPEVVRMEVNRAYETIRANETNINKEKTGAGKHGRKIAGAVAAAAAVVIIAGTPVMAKGIGRAWDSVVAVIFGADEKVQESYEETGLSQTFEVPGQEKTDGQQENETQREDGMQQGNDARQALPTAEVGGMTVSLQQVLTDGYQLYLYLDVEAPEGISLDDTCLFDGTNLLADGKPYEATGGSMGMCAGFVEDEYALAENHRGYEVVYFATQGIDLNGRRLTLTLSDFMIDQGKLDMKTAIEGVWTLEWDMDAAYHGKTVSIDLSGGHLGEHAALKSIDITPLSYALYYDYDGTDMELFDDSLWVAFVMKDGTILNECGNQDSLIVGNGGGSNMSCSREGFTKILDVDQVAGVLIDGVTYPVK